MARLPSQSHPWASLPRPNQFLRGSVRAKPIISPTLLSIPCPVHIQDKSRGCALCRVALETLNHHHSKGRNLAANSYHVRVERPSSVRHCCVFTPAYSTPAYLPPYTKVKKLRSVAPLRAVPVSYFTLEVLTESQRPLFYVIPTSTTRFSIVKPGRCTS